jgi:hypothetical protein
MTRFLQTKVSPVAWELAAPASLLLWRAVTLPLSSFWQDWLSIVCGYWIFAAIGSRSKAWPIASAIVMAGLLAIYAASQGPSTLAALGWKP